MDECLSINQHSSVDVAEEVFKYKLELLQIEYGHLEETVRSHEDRAFVIRGWAITAWVALVAFVIQTQLNSILWLALGSSLLFWFLDILFTGYRQVFQERLREIENFLNSQTIYDAFRAKSLVDFPTPRIATVWSEGFLWRHKKTILINTLLKKPHYALYVGLIIGSFIALRFIK